VNILIKFQGAKVTKDRANPNLETTRTRIPTECKSSKRKLALTQLLS